MNEPEYNFNERRFRLRVSKKIVGYMRKISKHTVFYSRDSFWWSGNSIDYESLDEWTGLKDKNATYVYEWDILRYKLDPDADYLEGVILWEGRDEVFGIRDLHDDRFIPLYIEGVSMFNPRQLEVFSQLYLNPHIMKKLGVRE